MSTGKGVPRSPGLVLEDVGPGRYEISIWQRCFVRLSLPAFPLEKGDAPKRICGGREDSGTRANPANDPSRRVFREHFLHRLAAAQGFHTPRSARKADGGTKVRARGSAYRRHCSARESAL